MKGNERRENLINDLQREASPVSAGKLAARYGVSRQVIVQDVALLRAQGLDIQATSSGYLLNSSLQKSRVFKSFHSDEETAEELTICVDLGGYVKDVFVYHRAYGVIRAELNIGSRLDIKVFQHILRPRKGKPCGQARQNPDQKKAVPLPTEKTASPYRHSSMRYIIL